MNIGQQIITNINECGKCRPSNKVDKKLDRRDNVINESTPAEDKKKRFELWKSQVNQKSVEELQEYLDRLTDKVNSYDNRSEVDLKSPAFYDLIDKLDYIEALLGYKASIGRTLH